MKNLHLTMMLQAQLKNTTVDYLVLRPVKVPPTSQFKPLKVTTLLLYFAAR